MNPTMSDNLNNNDLIDNLMSEKTAKNQKILNPKTNKLSFGIVPDDHSAIPGGDIHLKLGLIGYGPQRKGAFGARHIWEKHKIDLNLSKPHEIPNKIADILKEGINVLVEFDDQKRNNMPVVLNTAIGKVALAPKTYEGKVIYEIISAHANKNARGTVIGTLKSPSD
jgi:hypothetical protein